MPTTPIEVICKSCSAGPCKLGDIALTCTNPAKPLSVVTVQDMVNYTAIQTIKAKK